MRLDFKLDECDAGSYVLSYGKNLPSSQHSLNFFCAGRLLFLFLL